MALTPRRDEIAAVVAILESDEFEDSVAMSKALIREVAAKLAQRETFAVARGLQSDGLRVGYGPFYSQADATRVANANRANGLVANIVPVYPAEEAQPKEAEAKNKRCTCGHIKEFHGSSITPKAVTTLGCCVYSGSPKVKCSCKAYTVDK